MAVRVPRTSSIPARFPALVSVLAGGALLDGCHDPSCGPTRADEIETHGRRSVNAAGRGNAGDALHEIGVALGVTAHSSTRVHAAGEAMPVTTYAPNPPPPQEPPPVLVPRVHPQGGPMAVQPATPPQVAPVVPSSPTHAPHLTPRPPARGGRGSVHPVPIDHRVAPLGGEASVSPLPSTAPNALRRA